MPAKPAELSFIGLTISSMHGCLALPQTIHVNNRNQIVELVVSGQRGSFPHTSLRSLAVSHQDVSAVIQLVEFLRIQRHAHASGKPLAQGASRHIDPLKA